MIALFKKFKIAVTGRWAVALPTSLMTIGVGIVFAIERESILVPQNLNSRLLIVTCGELVAALYLFLAQLILLNSRKQERQNLLLCIFVWFSTGAIRGISSAFYAHFVLDLDFEFARRISNGMAFTGFTLMAFAFYAGTIEKNYIENKALRSLTNFLEHDEVELTESEMQARTHTLVELREFILPKAYKIQEIAKELSRWDVEVAATTLGSLRKQSEELALSIENERKKLLQTQVARNESHQYSNIRTTFFTGLFPKTISVRITMLVFGFGVLAGQLPRNGIVAGGRFALVDGLVIVAGLFVFSRISRRLTGIALFMIYPIAYGSIFVWQFLILKYQKEWGFDLPNPNNPLAGGLKTLINVYVPSVLASLITDTSRENEALTAKNLELRTRVAVLSQSNESLKNKAVAARFGVIQGKISGVIMALQILQDNVIIEKNRDKNEEFLTQTINLINSAISEINTLGRG